MHSQDVCDQPWLAASTTESPPHQYEEVFQTSDLPEAFPAVTVPVPSLIKAGFSFCSPSMVQPDLGNSSLDTVMGPVTQKQVLSLYNWFTCPLVLCVVSLPFMPGPHEK